MKKTINPLEYSKEILEGTKKGVLLTTKADNVVNTMAISWGTLGIQWERNIFIVFVRENRFTKSLLEKNGEFTINIPYGDYNKKIIGIAGTTSGHKENKIEKLNLTLVESDKISVPAIKELPLTLECKVVYKQKQDLNELPDDFIEKYYPQDIDSEFHGANKDCHTAYYGEILNSYIIED